MLEALLDTSTIKGLLNYSNKEQIQDTKPASDDVGLFQRNLHEILSKKS